MISLLVAIFGKNRIPNSVRYGLLLIGIVGLIYRLRKLYVTHKKEPELEIKVQPANPIVEVKQPPTQLGLLKYYHGY